MITVLIVIHVLICIALAIVVLLQAGKGGGLSGAFGGAGAQTVLGKRGAATFLSRLTRWVAVGFMLLSLGLAFIYSSPNTTVAPVEDQATEEGEEAAPDGEGQPADGEAEEATEPAEPSTEGAAQPAVPGGTTMPDTGGGE